METQKVESYYQGDRMDMIKHVPINSKKVLEIGCGEGHFAKMLTKDKREVWGVEYNAKAAEEASQVLYKVFAGAIEEIMKELPDNYFDLIIFNDVLEHLIDPSNVLCNIKEKLSINGQILASIPNLRFAKVLYYLMFEKDFTYTDFGILDSTHLRFFTKKTMRFLFENSGYTIHSISGINKSPSLVTKAFMLFLSILTFSNCSDVLYTQFVIIANKKNPTLK
jgi:2-polyprenyl-3-methyl-5-hydroxy-6-metoxy-1,4-benzoquinol methylase